MLHFTAGYFVKYSIIHEPCSIHMSTKFLKLTLRAALQPIHTRPKWNSHRTKSRNMSSFPTMRLLSNSIMLCNSSFIVCNFVNLNQWHAGSREHVCPLLMEIDRQMRNRHRKNGPYSSACLYRQQKMSSNKQCHMA